MSRTTLIVLILAIVALLGAAYMARYEIVASPTTDRVVIRLDRWTGAIESCIFLQGRCLWADP